MSLDARIQRLEALIGYDAQVQRDYEEDIQFSAKLLVWLQCAALTPEQWSACQQAWRESMKALDDPKFQKFRLAPSGMTAEEKDAIRRLFTACLREPAGSPSPVALHPVTLDADTRALWLRFAPHVPIPAQRVEALPPSPRGSFSSSPRHPGSSFP